MATTNWQYNATLHINFNVGVCKELGSLPQAPNCSRSEIKTWLDSIPETQTYKYELSSDSLKITSPGGLTAEYRKPKEENGEE